MQGIPKKLAQRICEEIRLEKRRKWYTYEGFTCWKCYKFSRGSIGKLHFSKKPGNRGCDLVNRKFEPAAQPREHKKAK